MDDYTKRKTEEDQIDPEYAAKLLDKYAAEDAIFTVDTGMNVVWAARFVKGTGKRYLTGSFNHVLWPMHCLWPSGQRLPHQEDK